MKIVGLIIIVMAIQPCFAIEMHLGSFKCKGNAYARLDDGRFAFQEIKAKYVPNPNYTKRTDNKIGDEKVYFVFEKEDAKILSYRRVFSEEWMFSNGKASSLQPQFEDFEFNRETLFKFKDSSAIGFDLICTMQ